MKKSYEVEDLDKAIRIFPLIEYKETKIYFFVYHSELSLWENILVNVFKTIKQKSK